MITGMLNMHHFIHLLLSTGFYLATADSNAKVECLHSGGHQHGNYESPHITVLQILFCTTLLPLSLMNTGRCPYP